MFLKPQARAQLALRHAGPWNCEILHARIVNATLSNLGSSYCGNRRLRAHPISEHPFFQRQTAEARNAEPKPSTLNTEPQKL